MSQGMFVFVGILVALLVAALLWAVFFPGVVAR